MADYAALLLKWNKKINLIGPATESDIWLRHIEDSVQLVPLIPTTAKTLVDFGSGAGLPGLVIAIQCPELSVTLVEQDQRKAAFLTEAKHRLGLSNVTIQAIDIAQLEGHYDIVTARALATLDTLLAMAAPHVSANAICLFPKGKNYAQEIDVAQKNWHFLETAFASKTNPISSILCISELSAISNKKR